MLGDNIRRLRRERGMNCKELADAVGTTETAIEQYEANRWRPGTQTLAKIAKVMAVGVDNLLEDCTLLKDGESNEVIIVRNIGDKQVRIVGTIKVQCEKE